MANHNDIKTLTAKIPMANPNQVNHANLASKQKNSDGHQFSLKKKEQYKCSYAKIWRKISINALMRKFGVRAV